MFGVLSLVYNRKHFLSLLLSLEMVILGVFLIIVLCRTGLSLELLVFFLVVVVCEAGLGLRILVIGVYFFGRDYFQREALLGC